MTRGQGTDTLTARMHKGLHRARVGVRKAGVDYFRGDGSDRFALAVLLIAIPAIAAGTLRWPEWIAPTALVLPVIARRTAAAVGQPPGPVRRLRGRTGRRGRAVRPVRRRTGADHPGHGPGRRRGRVLRAADRAVPQPGRGALAAWRHDALRPARTHPRPEQTAHAARGLAPRDGAAPGRMGSPSPATSWWPPAPTAATSSKWC